MLAQSMLNPRIPISLRIEVELATAEPSQHFGNPSVWPGDTIGLAYLPGSRQLPVSWGSAAGTSRTSEIWATAVHVPARG